jgi:CubicO group peptidase (beta-lactamase class C family)
LPHLGAIGRKGEVLKTKLIALTLVCFAIPALTQAQVTAPPDRNPPSAARAPYPQVRGWPGAPVATPSLRGSAALRMPALSPKADVVQTLRRRHHPEGNWGGSRCADADVLRSIVDDYLATPHPDYPNIGSTIPGASVSWTSPKCGSFNYAAGLRTIETNEEMTPASRMLIASMTKPIIAAVTLKLNDMGGFGPRGLDSTVDRLVPPKMIKLLTVGDDPGNPQCPGTTYVLNRDTFEYEFATYACPDLSVVTLRNLMTSNHGMYDFINEVLTPDGFQPYFTAVYYDLYTYFGLNPRQPASSSSGFENLRWFGLKRYGAATIGGVRGKDFESSFGNTGFQLLGVILEQRTRMSLDALIDTLIVEPLNTDPIVVYDEPRRRDKKFADGYTVVTGDPSFEQTGIYPLVTFHGGHKAVSNRSLGLGNPANIDLAGGAGGLIANPRSYARFLEAFVNGDLLGRQAQRELDNSFVRVFEFDTPTIQGSVGFGLLKLLYTGDPNMPDAELITHGGDWPGATCRNNVVRTHDRKRTLATGVICQNTNFGLAYPELFVALAKMTTAIVESDKGRGH